jgi:hypothetical protein
MLHTAAALCTIINVGTVPWVRTQHRFLNLVLNEYVHNKEENLRGRMERVSKMPVEIKTLHTAEVYCINFNSSK